MLSFGMEYERAFSIAFASARFAAGSGPPSRAATISARDSFEKSWPRFLSAAPFLCLIEDHLLCPDTHRLLHQLEIPFVDTRVAGELGMERRDDHATVAQQNRLAVELGQHLYIRAEVAHAGRADEDAAQGPVVTVEGEVGLEARDLPAVGVALHVDVDQAEVRAVEEDHPGTGPENGLLERADRIFETVQPHQSADRGRFASGNDEPVEVAQLFGLAHLECLCAQRSQH